MSLKELIEQYVPKYIRSIEKDDLVLYNYKELCMFDDFWPPEVMICRGLILHKETGNIVAKCMPKFFNLNQKDSFESLKDLKIKHITEKVDGSLGIIYHHNNKWQVATRGSFKSEQAIKGALILLQYDISKIPIDITLNVEIIYPENRIVVKYEKEELRLISAYRTSGSEVDVDTLETDIPRVHRYEVSDLSTCVKMCENLSYNEEGYVVCFESGLRIKLKGLKYLSLHRLKTNISLKNFIKQFLESNIIDIDIWYNDILINMSVPDEFLDDAKIVIKDLMSKYKEYKNIIDIYLNNLKDIDKKDVYKHLKDVPVKYHSCLYNRHKPEIIKKYILKFLNEDKDIEDIEDKDIEEIKNNDLEI